MIMTEKETKKKRRKTGGPRPKRLSGRKPGRRTDMQDQAHTVAFNLFCAGVAKKDIAIKLDVNINSVYRWATKHNWTAKEKEIQGHVNQQVMQKTVEMMVPGKEAYLERLCRITNKVSDRYEKTLDDEAPMELGTMDIKRCDEMLREEMGIQPADRNITLVQVNIKNESERTQMHSIVESLAAGGGNGSGNASEGTSDESGGDGSTLHGTGEVALPEAHPDPE